MYICIYLLSHRTLKGDSSLARLFPTGQRAVFKRNLTLGGFLCRAALRRQQALPRGCSHCSATNCSLHGVLQLTAGITSTTSGVTFPIKQRLCCDTRNVIYVITCRRCLMQGVGETANVKARMQSYIRAASNPASSGVSAGAIDNHFRNSPHSLGPGHYFGGRNPSQ